MIYINQATIIGNLVRDPELKALPSGNHVTNFSVATNRTWKDKDGKKQEDVEFHNVVAFGKQAETIAQYMKKGSQILVEGRIQTRKWEKDGIDRYTTEIIVEKFQFGQKATGLSDAEANHIKQVHENTGEVENPFNEGSVPF
jgi:single-strand DNA-binding protein